MTHKRKRKRFNFWLDDNSDSDIDIIRDIKKLKKKRKFSQAIRDGLRLIPSLMRGETDVLFEMFPTIHDKLYAQMEADIMERWQKQQEGEVINHLIELRGVIQSIKDKPVLSAPMQGTVTMQRVTTVTDETMQLEVKRVEGDGKSAQNFLNSMMALQGKTYKEPAPVNGIKQLSAPVLSAPVFDDDEDDMFYGG